MIQIYCGDDQTSSRTSYAQQLVKRRSENFLLINIVDEINRPEFTFEQNIGLFDKGTVYFGENIIAKKELRDKLKQISQNYPKLDIILWETQETRFIKQSWQNAKIIESKLPTNLFKFLDNISPGNLSAVNRMMTELTKNNDENIIFFMVTKRIRELILIGESGILNTLAPWQITKLKNQRQMWTYEKLLFFYDGLYRIEISNKTSESFYSLTQALSILFCLCL